MASIEDVPVGQHTATPKHRNSIDVPPSMSLRTVVFGSSGPHQFSLTESILQRAVFDGADPHTTLTTKTLGSLLGRNVTLVCTPNLNDHDFSHYMLKKELKKAVCFSCPGPHAVLFTLNPFDVPPNAYDIFKPVVQYFGESILNNTVIVLYHEKEQWSQSLEDSVKKNRDFRELLEKCGQRYVVFDGRRNRKESGMARELFDKIDTMVAERGIFVNVEFKDADKRIKREEMIIEKQRKKEVCAALESLEKKHFQEEDLDREVKIYKEKIQLENRERAEVLIADRLGFTLRLVDYAAAIGKGAFVGSILGAPMGFLGMAVGAMLGAALGGLLGGAAEAAWKLISGSLQRPGVVI